MVVINVVVMTAAGLVVVVIHDAVMAVAVI